MKKRKLLPGMAAKGIVANGIVYYPYIAAVIFAVFTHFIFSSILHNDLMEILPHRAYAWIILEMGKGLLEYILFFFLLYADSFVIKRRKKEIGLYTLLGLEKKHIGVMLFFENCIVYAATMAGGILLGPAALLFGYHASIRSQADDMILIDFALAVFFVVIGTYFLFTAGSVFFLKLLRRNKKLYYRPQNFITISGMYYRMKKNAAGLVNICIFSTMVIITLICTLSVGPGLSDVTYYLYPYDMELTLDEGAMTTEQLQVKLEELTEKYGLTVQRAEVFDLISLSCSREGSSFGLKKEDGFDERNCGVVLMTLAAYEELSGEEESLAEKEVLVYAEGADYGDKNRNGRYFIIVRDDAVRDAYVRVWAGENGVEDMDAFLQSGRCRAGVVLDGEDAEKTVFLEELAAWGREQEGIRNVTNGPEQRGELCSTYGGLLFIGVIFGVDFFLCLLIILYYKQISEGYEDAQSYAVMQKVGMSGDEIKHTVHKQILFVFGLPLLGAFAHTCAGMFMVEKLMVMIDFYDVRLMVRCMLGVFLLFTVIYVISYFKTAKTYYHIVNRTSL